MKPAHYLSLFACICIRVQANTEKTIFIAPLPELIPQPLQDLHLAVLTPTAPSLRAALPVAFPAVTGSKHPQGVESWYLLSNLNQGQRYEVRVCWAAIQPTTFWVDTLQASKILGDQELLQQLDRLSTDKRRGQTQSPTVGSSKSSILFLRVVAAADFYTTNATLMLNPPPVHVDIILDPFIGNIFPKSLLPTAVYITILAVSSWFISGFIWRRLSNLAQDEKAHAD
jgi:hypothetical protein